MPVWKVGWCRHRVEENQVALTKNTTIKPVDDAESMGTLTKCLSYVAHTPPKEVNVNELGTKGKTCCSYIHTVTS